MPPSTQKPELKILLIDDNKERAEAIEIALASSRYSVSHISSPRIGLVKQVEQTKPDIIVIDIESPGRDMLESVNVMSSFNPMPVVMFSNKQDSQTIDASVQSGVTAYLGSDIDLSKVRPILDAAVAQFQKFQQLREELEATKQQLQSSNNIEKAKQILMRENKLTESEAYHQIRKMAMDTGQKVEAVANTLLSFFQQKREDKHGK